MTQESGPRRGHVDLITEAARDALTVRRAFGDPITHGDVTVIPVARVLGGNGIGFGSGALDARRSGAAEEESEHSTAGGGQGDGGGGGFGVRVRPIGVFVVNGDDAEWQPTLDVTRIVLMGQAVAVVAVLATAHVIRYKIAHSAPTSVAAPGPIAARVVGMVPRLPHLPRPHLVRRTAAGTAHVVAALLSRRR